MRSIEELEAENRELIDRLRDHTCMAKLQASVIRSKNEQIAKLHAALQGAEERARILLDAKNYWADKYRGLLLNDSRR